MLFSTRVLLICSFVFACIGCTSTYYDPRFVLRLRSVELVDSSGQRRAAGGVLAVDTTLVHSDDLTRRVEVGLANYHDDYVAFTWDTYFFNFGVTLRPAARRVLSLSGSGAQFTDPFGARQPMVNLGLPPLHENQAWGSPGGGVKVYPSQYYQDYYYERDGSALNGASRSTRWHRLLSFLVPGSTDLQEVQQQAGALLGKDVSVLFPIASEQGSRRYLFTFRIVDTLIKTMPPELLPQCR